MESYGPILEQFASLYADNEALGAQLRAVSVTAEDWDINRAGGHFQLGMPPDTAVVNLDIIDALADDADGTMIDIILHFVGGRLNWGEWYRVDAEPIQAWPPSSIRRHPSR